MRDLRPFWRYYGGKWRTAPRYPSPRFGRIVEPFAGAAGYSLRYPDRDVTLVDAYPVVAGIWRYLIAASSAEILAIPLVDCIDDLPAWVPQEARWLVGFSLTSATTSPRRTLSRGWQALRESGRQRAGWSEAQRFLVASQVDRIRHWRVIEGDYTAAPSLEATWFVDPPYANAAGRHYPQQPRSFSDLGDWCRGRLGQVIVCEQVGADWLPFAPFLRAKAGPRTLVSNEAVWCSDAI